MLRGERPNTPSAPHVRLHQTLNDVRRAIRWYDPRPQAMAGIGSDAEDLLLVAVERISIEAGIFVPESLVEAAKEHPGFSSQLTRPIVFADMVIDIRHAKP